MHSPKLPALLLVLSSLLCLSGCAGFSTSQAALNPPPPADFTVSANPTSAALSPGGQASIVASVFAQGTFSGTVTMSVVGVPSGVTATFTPATVNTSGDSTLSLTAGNSLAAGTYTLTIIGTSGTLTNSADVTLVVSTTSTTPDFSLSASPNAQTLSVGGSTSFSTTVGALNGFTGTVSLTLSGLPAGMGANFSQSAITTSGTVTLNVSTNALAVAGTYTLTIGGTSGALSHSTTVNVTVTSINPPPDFSLSAAPSSQTLTAGNNTSFILTVAAANGFAGTVTFVESGMPAGMQASCSPSSITVSGTCTLNVSTTTATAAGTYTLTVIGTSGSLTHSVAVSVTVTASNLPPDFSLTASPSSQTVAAGNSTSFTLTVAASNGFNGAVTFVESGVPAGMTAGCSPSSITGSGTCTLNISTTTATAAGTYTLNITGTSGSLTHSTSVNVTVTANNPPPDFSLSVSPSAQTVTAGQTTTFTASVSASNGFTGTVALSATGLPTGVTASFSPTSIKTSGTSTLTLTTSTSAAVGASTLTITGTSGALTHNTNVTLTVTSAQVNFATCNGQQVPNWQSAAFQTPYKSAIQVLVNHIASASYTSQVGYMRIGLGKGGEINLPQGWNDSTTGACYTAYTNTWGYTVGTPTSNWNQYLQGMVQFEGGKNFNGAKSVFPLLVSITPVSGSGNEVDDFIAPIAVATGMSFGNQGLEASDIANYPNCGADWCNLFSQYSPAISEMQTLYQSCPEGTTCTNQLQINTGPLDPLLPFAVQHGANDLELYYQDWLIAYDPAYAQSVGVSTATANAYKAAIHNAKVAGASMQVLFPPPNSGEADFPAVQQYLMSNPDVTGVVVSIDWSDFDLGGGQYNFSIPDAEVALYSGSGKAINLVLQNTTYGGSTCASSGTGSNGQSGVGNCAMPPYMWTALAP